MSQVDDRQELLDLIQRVTTTKWPQGRQEILDHIQRVEDELSKSTVDEVLLESVLSALGRDVEFLKRLHFLNYRGLGHWTEAVVGGSFTAGVVLIGISLYKSSLLLGAFGLLSGIIFAWFQFFDPKRKSFLDLERTYAIAKQALAAGSTRHFQTRFQAPESIQNSVRKQRQSNYRVYLQSDEWQELREMALERAGYRCQICSSTDGLQVHHRTYENIFEEDEEDLTVLCEDCHELFHTHGRLTE